MTTDDSTLTLHSHATSAPLLYPPSLDVKQSTIDSNISLTTSETFNAVVQQLRNEWAYGQGDNGYSLHTNTKSYKNNRKRIYIITTYQTQGTTITTTNLQHLSSDLANQNDAQLPSIRPHQHHIIWVI